MKLYLHIGTEKTGSSYLQTLLARNRKQLIIEKIYFPKALKLENQMMEGKVSPGNGQHLFEALRDKKYTIVHKYLSGYITKAKRYNCQTVLISNELLVQAFSDKNKLNSFLKLTEELGFTKTEFLLIIRDPINQALSLYKHRAKNGNVESIQQWVTKRYHLATELEQFLINIKDKKQLCKIRKYRKDDLYMNSILFNDWLQINTPKERLIKSVNPSLTISELIFLKELYKKNKFLSKVYYKKMIDIPICKKAENKKIEEYYKSILNNQLLKFASTWLLCNKNLQDSEQLVLPIKLKNNIEFKNLNLTFSESQYKAIASILSDSLNLRFYLKLEWLKLKSNIGFFKNKYIK